MRSVIYRYRWWTLLGIAIVLLGIMVMRSDYSINYDRSMENSSRAAGYQNEAVKYVEPDDAGILSQMRSIVETAPPGIDPESQAWKIWAINHWVDSHINYVEDPPGGHYKPASEILETGFGDCDDFSILMASLYEAAGLDAALVVLNTDEDPEADHMACAVYWPREVRTFLDEEKDILKKNRITSPVTSLRVKHIVNEMGLPMLGKYTTGILLLTDVIMSEAASLVGYIDREPYGIVEIIDVGG